MGNDINIKENNMGKTDRLLKIKGVIDLVSMKKSTLYRKIEEGAFPAPVKLGKSSFWKESTIQNFIESLTTKGHP